MVYFHIQEINEHQRDKDFSRGTNWVISTKLKKFFDKLRKESKKRIYKSIVLMTKKMFYIKRNVYCHRKQHHRRHDWWYDWVLKPDVVHSFRHDTRNVYYN